MKVREASLHVLHVCLILELMKIQSTVLSEYSLVLNLILTVSICVVLSHVCWAFDKISVGSSLINFTY